MKLKLLLTLAVTLCFDRALVAEPVPAPPSGQRVFVCAHSFHIFTDKLLPGIARSAGIADHVPAGSQMIGGSRTIQHWNLPDDKNKAKAALRAGNVDVFTCSPHMLLPDEGIDNFTKLGLEKNPKLRVLVQASWPARDGKLTDRDFHNARRDTTTLEELHAIRAGHSVWFKSLEAQVAALNQAVGHEAVFIVPVSDAVFALRERVVESRAPGITKQSELFRDDLGHPNPPMMVLVTYCQFAAIYQRSPVGLPVPAAMADVPEAEALNRGLQEIAWEAVSKYPKSGVVEAGAQSPDRQAQ